MELIKCKEEDILLTKYAFIKEYKQNVAYLQVHKHDLYEY